SPALLVVTGKISSINLPPLMNLVPLDGTSDLSVSANLQGGNLGNTMLLISPAKLMVPLIDGQRTVVIHGGDPTKPFSFSSAGPWHANVSILDQSPFELRSDNNALIRITRDNINGIGLQRDSNSVVTLSITNKPGSQLTVFPGKPIQQTFKLTEQTTLVVRS